MGWEKSYRVSLQVHGEGVSTVDVKSLALASAAVTTFQDAARAGASDLTEEHGTVYIDGRRVGRISYNGRWREDAKLFVVDDDEDDIGLFTIAEFLEVNEGLDDVAEKLDALDVGKVYRDGGGAQPEWKIERVA